MRQMSLIFRILFFPIYLMLLLFYLIAEIVQHAFSYVCGFFFLLMVLCMIVTILNHAWAQTLLLLVLMLIGYSILFGVVAIKVVIEEAKNLCLGKMF